MNSFLFHVGMGQSIGLPTTFQLMVPRSEKSCLKRGTRGRGEMVPRPTFRPNVVSSDRRSVCKRVTNIRRKC